MSEQEQYISRKPTGRLREVSPGNTVEIYTQGPNRNRRTFEARVIETHISSTQPNNPAVVVEEMGTEKQRKELHLGGGTLARIVDPSEPTPLQRARQGIEAHMRDASGLRFQAFTECITRDILDVPAKTPEDEAKLKTLNKAIARSKRIREGYKTEFEKASAVIGYYNVAFEKGIKPEDGWVTAKYSKLPNELKEIREQEWQRRAQQYQATKK